MFSLLLCFHISQLRELVGSSDKKTLDPDYEAAVQRYESLGAVVREIKEDVNTWILHLQSYLNATLKTASAFQRFYSNDGKKPHPRFQLAHVSEAARSKLLTKEHKQLEERANANIVTKLDEILERLAALTGSMTAREESRQQYDHYQSKIIALRQKHQQAVQRGREETPKEREKLERNEQKLAQAEATYKTANETAIVRLNDLWQERFGLLDPIFVETLETEKVFVGLLHLTLSKLQPDALDSSQVGHASGTEIKSLTQEAFQDMPTSTVRNAPAGPPKPASRPAPRPRATRPTAPTPKPPPPGVKVNHAVPPPAIPPPGARVNRAIPPPAAAPPPPAAAAARAPPPAAAAARAPPPAAAARAPPPQLPMRNRSGSGGPPGHAPPPPPVAENDDLFDPDNPFLDDVNDFASSASYENPGGYNPFDAFDAPPTTQAPAPPVPSSSHRAAAPPPPLPRGRNAPPNRNTGRSDVQDAIAVAQFAQAHPDETRQAAQWANNNRDQAVAAAQWANNNRETVAAGAQWASENRETVGAAARFAGSNAATAARFMKK
jgi:BAR domain